MYQGRDVNGAVSNDDNCAIKRDIVSTQQLVIRRSTVVSADESSLHNDGDNKNDNTVCSDIAIVLKTRGYYTAGSVNWKMRPE